MPNLFLPVLSKLETGSKKLANVFQMETKIQLECEDSSLF